VHKAVSVVEEIPPLQAMRSAEVGQSREERSPIEVFRHLSPLLAHGSCVIRWEVAKQAAEVLPKNVIPDPFKEITLCEAHGEQDLSPPGVNPGFGNLLLGVLKPGVTE
jgi:hypothetical protein